MTTDDFSFDLPEDLVAQYPTGRRGDSRLLVLDRSTGTMTHSHVLELPSFIKPGSLLVFNDSRVRKARIYGESMDTGASIEFLLLERHGNGVWETLCSRAGRQRPGRQYRFPENVKGTLVSSPLHDGCNPDVLQKADRDSSRFIRFDPDIDEAFLERNGHIPLPPYIKRGDELSDSERYQTVYARTVGSSASPTAGLHFTPGLMDSLSQAGIGVAWVTLHVGLGTFLPVRTDTIEDHKMHEERYTIPEETVHAVAAAKSEGRPVVAIGTTSLRTLESAWTGNCLHAGPGSTRIFIYPGYSFKVVDHLFTNFHTPRSTLLMLVSAFAGRDRILDAYAQAIEQKYRFFSYGDAMFIR